MDKMRSKGTPLKDWEIKINRGITTGYNDAFIIDDKTKEALVAESPSSKNIIKPVLRGKDIQRYRAKWAGMWVIYSHSKIAQDEYPAVRRHLLADKKKLLKRRGGANPKTGQVPYEWWQLQVDYYSSGAYKHFGKEKLFWMDLTEKGRFSYDPSEMFCADTVFMMSGQSIKYLCAMLNSNLITWFMRNTALTSGMGVTRWKRFAVETIPIPRISTAEQHPFIQLVDCILTAKADDPEANTRDYEAEIDQLVYALYGLTGEEIVAVEGQ